MLTACPALISSSAGAARVWMSAVDGGTCVCAVSLDWRYALRQALHHLKWLFRCRRRLMSADRSSWVRRGADGQQPDTDSQGTGNEPENGRTRGAGVWIWPTRKHPLETGKIERMKMVKLTALSSPARNTDIDFFWDESFFFPLLVLETSGAEKRRKIKNNINV